MLLLFGDDRTNGSHCRFIFATQTVNLFAQVAQDE